MPATFAEIYYLLGKQRPVKTPFGYRGSTQIERMRIWHGQEPERGCLYIVSASTPGQQPRLALADAALAEADAGENAQQPSEEIQQPFKDIQQPFEGASRLLEDATDALLDIERWDGALKEALFANASLATIYGLGENMIPELLSLVDPELSIIVAGEPLSRHPHDIEGMLDQDADGRLRLSDLAVSQLLQMDDYPSAAFEKDVFLYPGSPGEALYICGNIFAGEENRARLVADCPQGLDGLALEGAMSLFRRLLQYLRQTYLRSWQERRGLSTDDDLHRVLRLLIDNPQQVEPERLATAAAQHGWSAADTYLVVRARFLEGAYWLDMAGYICSRLEQSAQTSIAVSSDGEIIWVCDLDGEGGADERMLFSKLSSVVCDYRCKAGVSRHLAGIEQIPMGSDEARTALEVGLIVSPNLWYYRFEECATAYLLEKMTAEFPVSQLVHPCIGMLERYDALHGTGYLDTLKLYFDCGYNVSEAASKSYVHRTTFSRRLDRIQEIGGFDPHDPGTRLYLAISFWLLGEASREHDAQTSQQMPSS